MFIRPSKTILIFIITFFSFNAFGIISFKKGEYEFEGRIIIHLNYEKLEKSGLIPNNNRDLIKNLNIILNDNVKCISFAINQIRQIYGKPIYFSGDEARFKLENLPKDLYEKFIKMKKHNVIEGESQRKVIPINIVMRIEILQDGYCSLDTSCRANLKKIIRDLDADYKIKEYDSDTILKAKID